MKKFNIKNTYFAIFLVGFLLIQPVLSVFAIEDYYYYPTDNSTYLEDYYYYPVKTDPNSDYYYYPTQTFSDYYYYPDQKIDYYYYPTQSYSDYYYYPTTDYYYYPSYTPNYTSTKTYYYCIRPCSSYYYFDGHYYWCPNPCPTTTATIDSPPAPTVDIKANGSDGSISISYNASATLSWTSTNATSCYASGDWSGSKSLSGSESTGNLTSSKTYIITCTGSGGSASDSVTVNVQSPPPLSVSLTASPSSGCSPLNNVDLIANVSGGDSGNITYYFDCTNDGSWERITTQNSTSYTAYDICNYYSAGTYNARIRVERDGRSAENTTQIYVSSCSPPAPTVDIKANGSDGSISISYNASATLSWTSTNATSCYASGDWSGSKSLSGSESTGNLTSSKTYIITCTGSGGSASDSVTVNVISTSSLSINKLVRNLSDGTGWQEEVNADPSEILSFSIQITATGTTTLQNVIVKDTLPAKMIYQGNLKIDNISSSGDILYGLNIGNLMPGQTKNITFDVRVASSDQFNFGKTELINTVLVYNNITSASDTAKVNVIKTGVAGAVTGIVTGVNNPIYLSLIFAFLLSLSIFLLLPFLENSQNPFIKKVLRGYYKVRLLLFR